MSLNELRFWVGAAFVLMVFAFWLAAVLNLILGPRLVRVFVLLARGHVLADAAMVVSWLYLWTATVSLWLSRRNAALLARAEAISRELEAEL